MFQRIKATIDSKIAEEQAKSRFVQPESPSRSVSGARRAAARALSPTRNSRQASRGRKDGGDKGADPADFVIDDEELSRASTPKPPLAGDAPGLEEQREAKSASDATEEPTITNHSDDRDVARPSLELPTDVKVRLRKLEKLEGRYQELLRSYRIAHARVQSIDTFENALRESTPLTSINEPAALTEYLSQVNVKGGMVLDELKRVSAERDGFKSRLLEAEEKIQLANGETAKLRVDRSTNDVAISATDMEEPDNAEKDNAEKSVAESDPLHATTKPSAISVKTSNISLPGISLFSPRSKSGPAPKIQHASEDLFSYDGEIPRLESEVKEKTARVRELESEITKLKTDLNVARESTQSMVETLEEATLEVNSIRDTKDRADLAAQEKQDVLQRALSRLEEELAAAKLSDSCAEAAPIAEDEIKMLKDELQTATQDLEALKTVQAQSTEDTNKISQLQIETTRLEAELSTSQVTREKQIGEIESLRSDIADLKVELRQAEANNVQLTSDLAISKERANKLEASVKRSSEPNTSIQEPVLANVTNNSNSANAKKNKKKRKGGNVDGGAAKAVTSTIVVDQTTTNDRKIAETESSAAHEVEKLRVQLKEKESALDNILKKLKDQEGLQDEIETLRESLTNVGQEHVEIKERAKILAAEKSALEDSIAKLEEELTGYKTKESSTEPGLDAKYKVLITQFDELKIKGATLQSDLSAAQQLAAARFKDLNELRTVLQKAQPEINQLRGDAAEAKSTKEALARRESEFSRLEHRHDDIKAEVGKLRQTIATREMEIRALNKLNSSETNGKSRAEESLAKAQHEVNRLEDEKNQATSSLDRVSREIGKLREELATHKSRLRETEQQLSKQKSAGAGLQEENELKAAQYASAQSLMASMRDQTAEMVVQTKEARDRCESLEEEVADAHRLLSERSREGETMRRLLADVEGRTDARTRELKERMDSAIEERDRAEEEASTAGRRRAREMEDLRNQYRDLERSSRRAEDEKEELIAAQRDWKRRREDLEQRSAQATNELEEVRQAMAELRDALDESERQARDLEKQKTALRQSVEETQVRLEKLQKANKNMADEITKARENKVKAIETPASSSRSSVDNAKRIHSPSPSTAGRPSNGAAAMDYVYLKNVLLQFLEQRDKKHQMQLIPVLGMLLHFDRKDEQKWMSAITTTKV